jgi:hypothetical protein
MKRNILVVMFAMILALTFSFTFTSCKKAEQPKPVVEEKKFEAPAADATKDAAKDAKAGAKDAKGDSLIKKAVDAGKGAAKDAAASKAKGKLGL